MSSEIDESARVVDSSIGQTELREFVTVHDSDIGDGCRIYERSSLKKCSVGDNVDINAGCYIENAEIGDSVQVGPNSSLVGVTHDLDDAGMEFRNDVFEQILIKEGAFIGAGAVVTPGVEIGQCAVVSAGATVTDDIPANKIAIGSPPQQKIRDLTRWTSR